MSVSASGRIQELVSEFSSYSGWEERYKKMIEAGKSLSPLDDLDRIESNKVRGCQSQVWLAAKLEGGQVYFSADSDASIVKGIIALLLRVYSGLSPKEILEIKTTFLEEIGLQENLSMSRANGLASMLKQIKLYAYAFHIKLEKEGL